MIAAVRQKAVKQGTLMDIAVMDAGANLKALVWMDDAFLRSIDISIKKAKTAQLFNMPTGNLGKAAQPGAPLYNIEFSNGGLITFPGDLPLKNKAGTIVGAIGVSGSTVEDDHEVRHAQTLDQPGSGLPTQCKSHQLQDLVQAHCLAGVWLNQGGYALGKNPARAARLGATELSHE